MINKFFYEYGSQKAAWIHEEEIVNETSKSIKVLSKNEEILRNRILRTFLKRDKKTQKITSYNFDPATFKQYLMIYDAIIPSVITQNDKGDFVLLFETDNQLAAFEEAFSNGLEIKGTTVYFKKVGYRDLGTALQTVKSLINRKNKEKKKNKKAWIVRLFPRNTDDKINCGGLLQSKHPCSIDLNEIFHKDWYQESLHKFPFEAKPFVNNNNNNNNNNKDMNEYYHHLKCVNQDIWNWYYGHIPTDKQMRKIYDFLQQYLLINIHKTLNLPNIEATNLNKMMSIFGSASYGLFINKFSDIDIGINLNIIEKVGNNKQKSLSSQKNQEKNKKVKFLQLLSNKIKKHNTNIFNKIKKNKQHGNDGMMVDKKKPKPKPKQIPKKPQNRYVKYHKKWNKLERKDRPKRDIIIVDERFGARVPILKLYIPPLKISMDISINNESNLVSKLIMLYVKYDIRIRPFLCAIKYWCNQRSICNAFKGYLNTFGWILLGIKLLQNGLDIPILPLMKIDIKSGAVMINKENMKENNNNTDTVAELLSSFFEYYANFDFNKYQISIINNEKYALKNTDKFQMKPHQSEWIIQHPLKTYINVSSSVKKWTAHLMKKELSIASDMILQSNWNALTHKINDQSQTLHIDPQHKCSCLLFRNLRFDVNEQHIKKFVSRVAKPISVVMSKYKSGRHIGKSYVAFETADIAHNVMAELNGNLLVGRPVVMLFAPLESIDDAGDKDHDDDKDEDEDMDINLKPVKFTRKIKLIGRQQKKSASKHKQNKQSVSDGLLLD